MTSLPRQHAWQPRTVTPFALHLITVGGRKTGSVAAGFTSVMIDGRHFPSRNIRLSREAVDFAHCYGVSVEAELGAIRGKRRRSRL